MACPFCEPSRFEKDVIAAHDIFHERGVRLTKQQARCMAALLAKDGTVTIDMLMAAIWGEHDEPENAEQVLRVQLTKCRKKITEAGLPWTIHSTFGLGYALDRSGGKQLKTVAVSLLLMLCAIYPVSKLPHVLAMIFR